MKILVDALTSIKRKKKELGLLVCSSAFGLFLVLALSEAYHVSKPKLRMGNDFDPEIGWVNIKNMDYKSERIKYSTNSLGFRSNEIDPLKKHAIILGDSVAFGIGLDDKEIVSYYLGQEVRDLQFLNTAVVGYGIDQYYLTLKRFIKTATPKLIIVIICTRNDLEETSLDAAYGFSKPLFISENGKLKNINPDISRYSCQNIFSTSWLLSTNLFRPLNDRFCAAKVRALTVDQTWVVILGLLKNIVELAEQNHSRLLFVISPSQRNFAEEKAHLDHFNTVMKQDTANYGKLRAGP